MREIEIKPFLDATYPLRLILEAALDAVVVLHSDGTIREWNPVAENIFGWRRAEVLGRPMAERIIPDRYRAQHYRGLARYFETGEGPLLRKRVEITALRRSGEEFPVALSISHRTSNGETLFVAFVRDLSDNLSSHRPVLNP